jgi:hypothetical protein
MHSPLLRTSLLLLTVSFFASCAPATPKEAASPEGNPLTDEPGSVVIPVTMDPPAPKDPNVLTLDEALSEQFASQKLGITLRYPKTIYSVDCDADVPLQARELKDGVIFTTTYVLGEDCKTHVEPSPSDVVNEAVQKGISATDAGFFNAVVGGWSMIHVRPTKNETDLQAFVDAVFSKQCQITERGENGDNVRIFVGPRPEFKEDTDAFLLCSDSFTWNKPHGIALYSSLASKNGGGFEIGGKSFIDSSGSETQIYDFEIMRSLQML